MKRLSIIFLEFFAGLAGNLIAGWIQQDIFGNVFSEIRIASTIIGALIMLMLIAWLEQFEIKQRVNLSRKSGSSFLTNSNVYSVTKESPMKFDVFISHASEDKDEFVRPLAEKLRAAGYRVWYNEFTLKFGDSLRASIDAGLSSSRFGIVVLSNAFFGGSWSLEELGALFARQVRGRKIILPICHNISFDELVTISPLLADKFALSTNDRSVDEIVAALINVLGN